MKGLVLMDESLFNCISALVVVLINFLSAAITLEFVSLRMRISTVS
jgi:hypothetical protein